ncbi:MAG: hypothetical protein IKO75_08490 [Bacteroidales bacterium]|nr:hypothetical protein [Bacteroidales bacterium]
MNNKNIYFTTLFIVVLTVVGVFPSDAQSILGRDISFRKYVRLNNRRSREEVIREAVKSYAFLYLTIKDGDFQGKVMMSNDALINYYHKWMPDSLLQDNPSYEDWATNIILNEVPLDVTGFYREYHKVDSLVNWKGPKYKLLEKCIELCDKDIIDYNILATLFQWNIVLDNVDEELHLYFFPLEFRQYGREP